MVKKDVFTKILAIAGTVLVWFPLLAPFLLGMISFIGDGIFRFDYFIPAELFPIIVGGWILLIWAALRARSRLKLIIWGAGITIGMAVIGAVLAQVTGLATGANEPTGWRVAIVISAFVLFILAIMATGVGGILLLRDLFQSSQLPTEKDQR